MDKFRENFDMILSFVKQTMSNILNKDGNIKRPGPKPKFSDAEVITLSLLSEILMIDSENYLFKKLNKNHKKLFPNLIERSAYNKRRKINSVRLKTTVHLLRLHLHSFFTETVVGRLKNDFTCHEF